MSAHTTPPPPHNQPPRCSVLITSVERAGQSAGFFVWFQGGSPPGLGYQSPCWSSHVGSVSFGSQTHFLEAKTLLSGPGFKKPVQQRGLTPGPSPLNLRKQNGKQRKSVEQRIQVRVTGPPDLGAKVDIQGLDWSGTERPGIWNSWVRGRGWPASHSLWIPH